MESLPVNLLIKQAPWQSPYDFVIENIAQMRKKHEGNYKNLHYIDPAEDIMNALTICDLVVSDESNVMLEALLLSKPSIAVSDWLIPDCNPPRFANFPDEYAIHCNKASLKKTVEAFIEGKLNFDPYQKNSENLFGPRGNVCKNILDAIEYYTGYGTRCDFLNQKLIPSMLPFD